MDRPEPSESETKTILIRSPLQRQFVEDVSSETAVLVEYWRLRRAIVGSLRGLLGPFDCLLAPSWTAMRSSETFAEQERDSESEEEAEASDQAHQGLSPMPLRQPYWQPMRRGHGG